MEALIRRKLAVYAPRPGYPGKSIKLTEKGVVEALKHCDPQISYTDALRRCVEKDAMIDHIFPPQTSQRPQNEIHPLAQQAVEFKTALGKAGLFKTMHKMEEVVTAIGWELAEKK